jgi:hypothetical protein
MAQLKKFFPILLTLALVAGLGYRTVLSQTASSHATASPTLQGDKAHPAQTSGWVDTKLYFGLGPIDNTSKGVTEVAWRDFLDAEVTPRFPSGLSVVDVYGQWQGVHQTKPERIRSKMLVIDYPRTAENDAKVEAIRAAWKQRTHDQSVLKVSEPADVSF